MNLACLFWCYKAPSLCENRLRIFRLHNPTTRVFALFGGDPALAPDFERRLTPYVDDFYAFREDRTERWKWRHGDRMIARWFSDRGHALDWDSIFVLQWDMLVFDRLERQFPSLQKGELLISGLRPVAEVSQWWSHLRVGTQERAEYEQFLAFVGTRYGFRSDPMCGLFIVVCLPREFLARYSPIPDPELGFLEYKVPVYAQIFGTPLRQSPPHDPWWDDDPRAIARSVLGRALNAGKQNVPLRVIEAHRMMPGGRRIFHPVFRHYPMELGARLRQTAAELYKDEVKRRWWRLNRQLFGHK